MADNDSQTPPWGEDFDAERAWKLILALRADKVEIQGKVDSLTADLDTERQARSEAETKATAAESKLADESTRADKAEGDLHVERAVRKHGVPDDLIEFLTGTPEEIEAKAERLSKLGKPEAKPEGDEETPGEKPEESAGRPKPDLTPGHGGTPPEAVDTNAIVASIKGSATAR